MILDQEITKRGGNTKITGYSYTPIFTVAERGKQLRSLRIEQAMGAYDGKYIDRVSEKTYQAMAYALQRIQARVAGE